MLVGEAVNTNRANRYTKLLTTTFAVAASTTAMADSEWINYDPDYPGYQKHSVACWEIHPEESDTRPAKMIYLEEPLVCEPCSESLPPNSALFLEVGTLYFHRSTANNSNRESWDYFPHHPNRLDAKDDLATNWQQGWQVTAKALFDNEWTLLATYRGFSKWRAEESGIVDTPISLDWATKGLQTPLGITTALQQSATVDISTTPTPWIPYAQQISDARYSAANSSKLSTIDAIFGYGFCSSYFGLGAGYLDLTEDFSLKIFGTFAMENAPYPAAEGDILTHQSLIANTPAGQEIAGGGFTLLSGNADGFLGEKIGEQPSERIPSEMSLEYRAEVQNKLFGGSVAYLMTPFCRNGFATEFMIQGGVYHNTVTGTITEYATETNLTLSNYRRVWDNTKSTISFLAAAKVGISYEICRIKLKASYEAFVLTGVALAADQWFAVRNDNSGNLTYLPNLQATLFYHGPQLSLQACW